MNDDNKDDSDLGVIALTVLILIGAAAVLMFTAVVT